MSISQKSGIDPVENLMNFYRDANGQLLSFEYKGKIYDYVYNQRGDIVAITNELGEIIARYTYDEWGNLQKIDAPTPLGSEVANANPFRYVGKFGVQYDNHTKLYFMGWRDYDAKIGRFLVADEYEGEDTNPISFNRYLYAESDPVNNIDPDGHATKWLKKIAKGVKKAGKAAYNFVVGNDIKTMKSKNTKWHQKAGAAISISSNFVPGGGIISKAAKVAVKGTAKAVRAVKASKVVVKASKVVKTSAKKAASVVNTKPKTVPAPSIKSAPKLQPVAPAKVSVNTTQGKPKVADSGQPERGLVATRVEKNSAGNSKDGEELFAAKGTGYTNEQLVQEIATRAERKIGGTGSVAGTKKHTYAKDLLDRYQSIYGDRGLKTETSWLNNQQVPYGTKGSARLDVLDINTGDVFDYKFTIKPGKGLSQRQTNKILNHGPLNITNIKEVNP